MERTITPKVKSLRRNLEDYVVAHNKVLKKAVKDMSPIILLRNAHTTYRPDFARELRKAGAISEYDSKEFINIR